jgi:lipoate-protein ligase B
MEFKILDLGLIEFQKAWQVQRETFGKIKNNYFDAALILCQHYPVITLGRHGKIDNLRVSLSELENRRIMMYEIDRGGDITYHGPGQLTAYPILNLNYFKKDIHLFLRRLEGVAIELLSDFGIKGIRYPGLTGVWINRQKIASIGIAIKNWITFHGMSINIKSEDLKNFSLIKPCGMDIKITSLETLLSQEVGVEEIKKKFIDKFKNIFLIPH